MFSIRWFDLHLTMAIYLIGLKFTKWNDDDFCLLRQRREAETRWNADKCPQATKSSPCSTLKIYTIIVSRMNRMKMEEIQQHTKLMLHVVFGIWFESDSHAEHNKGKTKRAKNRQKHKKEKQQQKIGTFYYKFK